VIEEEENESNDSDENKALTGLSPSKYEDHLADVKAVLVSDKDSDGNYHDHINSPMCSPKNNEDSLVDMECPSSEEKIKHEAGDELALV
jgi:hypothetical protein